MKFVVNYTGETSWTKEYGELDTIEIFFKKYFEEMLAEQQYTKSKDSFVFKIVVDS